MHVSQTTPSRSKPANLKTPLAWWQSWPWVVGAAVLGALAILFQSSLPFVEWDLRWSPAVARSTDEESAAVRRAAGSSAGGLTYDEALARFGDHRIQFDGCSARPPRQTFKSGTTVMLDNRSEVPLQLLLDGQSYRMGAYGFSIVTLSRRQLPHTIQVDCRSDLDYGNNVARLLLQR